MNGNGLGMQHLLGMERGYKAARRFYRPNVDGAVQLDRYLDWQRKEQRAGYVAGWCAGWEAAALSAWARDGMLAPLDWRREVNEAEDEAA